MFLIILSLADLNVLVFRHKLGVSLGSENVHKPYAMVTESSFLNYKTVEEGSLALPKTQSVDIPFH
jgi:hypothetical protein